MELDRAAPEISPNLEESYDMLRCIYYYFFLKGCQFLRYVIFSKWESTR